MFAGKDPMMITKNLPLFRTVAGSFRFFMLCYFSRLEGNH